MYNDLNSCLVEGRLTRDPEMKAVGTENKVCILPIAINRSFRGKNGEEMREATYVDIQVWNGTAENCQRYLSKGDAIRAVGELRLDIWQTKDGNTARKHFIRCQHLEFRTKGTGKKESLPVDSLACPEGGEPPMDF
ncbi:MAG: single-stranded DNA-binding protein [Spirochaetia bacterium]|nr:single-stranded DNA-binding protein [Spirochaetia bacterium]